MRSSAARAMRGLPVLAVLSLVLLFGSRGFPQTLTLTLVDGREAVPGEVLVRFARALPALEQLQLGQQMDADADEPLTLDIHRNILISATPTLFSCWLLTAQHSVPYKIAGLTAVR